MIKGFIFDFDGLMIDSEVISYKCYKDFLGQYNIELDEEGYIEEFPGKETRLALKIFKEKFGIEFDTDEALTQIREYENFYMERDGVELKEGLIELLDYLKENNYKIVIATSSIKDRALKILDNHKIAHYFDDMTFGSEVERGKPFPDIFLKACEKLELQTDEVVVLEDSEAGIQAAYDANIPVVCIPDMKFPDEGYAEKPIAIFDSLKVVTRTMKHGGLL